MQTSKCNFLFREKLVYFVIIGQEGKGGKKIASMMTSFCVNLSQHMLTNIMTHSKETTMNVCLLILQKKTLQHTQKYMSMAMTNGVPLKGFTQLRLWVMSINCAISQTRIFTYSYR